MSGRQTRNTSLRKMISLLFLLGLLAIFLSLYLLKYVPHQRSDFHRRAFLELSQIERAFRDRSTAYVQAIQYSVDKSAVDPFRNNLLSRYFSYTMTPNNARIKKGNDSLYVRSISFEPQQTPATGWQITYQLYSRADTLHPVVGLSKKVDTILTPIVSTYKDIFDDYVLILDTHFDQDPGKAPEQSFSRDNLHEGRVIYNSGHLSLDYLVNTDSLLKKTDGFSLLNIHDVKIEGNSYKLFLYPIELCKRRIILSGLISLSKYNEGAQAVPVSLITIGSILALLLLLNLPLLKIYIIGPQERITSLDLRMIIITYFLAAFILFFLFSLFFLNRVQNSTDKTHLVDLSNQVQNSFFSEIDSICHQLDQYDTLYAALNLTDTARVRQLLDHRTQIVLADSLQKTLIRVLLRQRSKELLAPLTNAAEVSSYEDEVNTFFHPAIYPQMNNVFWIDSNGKWVARWGFEKIFKNLRRLDVGDRQYFRDIIDNNLLALPPPFGTSHSFSIQPTLSRVTGEYNINVVIKSHYASILGSPIKNKLNHKGKDSSEIPAMLGISSEMHTVCNTVMPPGYSFSIVNADGDILFDSKPGRALLSNIITEAEDNSDLRQSIRYRYSRYYKRFTLRGREVDMLTRPFAQLPYTLLVSYNTSVNHEFQFHALSLTCFCMACMLALIALTAFFNEWVKKKPTLLNIMPVNFQWLRPAPRKMAYYLHLSAWMGLLFIIYLLAGLVIELFFRKEEPALFLLALTFPFFIAIHYYLVREKQTMLECGRKSRTPAAIFPLGLILFIFLVYTLANGFDRRGKTAIFFVELLWGFTIFLSQRFLRLKEEEFTLKTLLERYTSAILTGVLLITLVPAVSLFPLFYKEESDKQIKMEKLNMARSIANRRSCINKKIPDYRFEGKDSSFLEQAKFKNGIYLSDSLTFDQLSGPVDPYKNFSGYADLHEFLFPSDSNTLETPGRKEMAGDSSWYFYETGKKRKLRLNLYYKNQNDRADLRDMKFPVNAADRESALGLIYFKLSGMNTLSILSSILGLLLAGVLAWLLTRSLCRHIFLIDLFEKYQRKGKIAYAPVIEKISRYERRFIKNAYQQQEALLFIQAKVEHFYARIWSDLSPNEKFILYDFALDELTNYKAGTTLYKLLQKGCLVIDHKNLRLRIATQSFHNYLLCKDLFGNSQAGQTDREVYDYMMKAEKEGSWQSFKTPLLILLAVIGLFVFFTQDALYQKIVGLLTSIPSLVHGLSSLFDKGNGNGKAPSDN